MFKKKQPKEEKPIIYIERRDILIDGECTETQFWLKRGDGWAVALLDYKELVCLKGELNNMNIF